MPRVDAEQVAKTLVNGGGLPIGEVRIFMQLLDKAADALSALVEADDESIGFMQSSCEAIAQFEAIKNELLRLVRENPDEED